MSDSVLNAFLYRQDEPRASVAGLPVKTSAAPDSVLDAFLDPTPVSEIGNDRGTGDTFSDGVKSGALGLAASTKYFSALTNTLVGDKEGAQEAIARAEAYENEAAQVTEGMGTFKEFKDSPTLGGFIEQTAKATGQMLPYALESIAGAVIGMAVAPAVLPAAVTGAVVGKIGLSKASQFAANKIVKEALRDTAAGVANENKRSIAAEAMKLYGQQYTKKKRNAAIGAGVAEYVPLAGENLSAGMGAGAELDKSLAVRSLVVAAPMAVVGVGSEAMLVSLVAKQAKRESISGKDGVMSRLAKEAGKGFAKQGTVEGVSEVAQEGISIANQMDLGKEFTAEDIELTLAESLFAGFMGGGSLAAAGAGAGSLLADRKEVSDTVSNVTEKARNMVNRSQRDRTENRAARDIVDGLGENQTTAESQETLGAQRKNMLNPEVPAATSMWESATKAPRGLAENTMVREMVSKDGENIPIYKAFIPGRGVITSVHADVVNNVINRQASDNVLAAVLGYSAVKPEGADLVVQALDEEGMVVREELTNAAGVERATLAMERMVPEGGQVREPMGVAEAQAERANKFKGEEPVIRDMDITEDDLTEANEIDFEGLVAQVGDSKEDANKQRNIVGNVVDANVSVFEPEQISEKMYKPRKGGTLFENTEERRADYVKTFGEVDWGEPFYFNMSEALLKHATDLQNNSPELQVELNVVGPRGDRQYKVTAQTGPETEVFNLNDRGKVERLTLGPFLKKSIKIAARVARAKERKSSIEDAITLTDNFGDGKKSVVQKTDMANLGRRLLEGRQEETFQGSAEEGLQEAIKELTVAGYGITSDSKTLQRMFRISKDRRYTKRQVVNAKATSDTTNEELGYINQDSASLEVAKFYKKFSADPAVAVKEDMEWLDKPEAITEIDGEAVLEGRKEDISIADRNTSAYKAQLAERNLDKGTLSLEELLADKKEQLIDLETAGDDAAAGKLTKEIRQLETKIYEGSSANTMDMGQLGPLEVAEMPPHRTMYSIKSPRKGAKRTLSLDITFPAGSIGATAHSIITKAHRELRLKKPVSVFGTKELNAMSLRQRRALFPLGGITSHIEGQLDDLNADKSRLGRYIGYKNAHIIIVDNDKNVNDMQTAIVAAHELGHALFMEEQASVLENDALNKRLLKAFATARDAEGAPAAYQNELGFEEWYADQVAIWAREGYAARKPRNITEGHFKRFVGKLRNMWAALVNAYPAFRKRFGAQDKAFQSYMNGLVKENRANRADKQTDEVGADEKIITAELTRLRRDLSEAKAVDAEAYIAPLEEQISAKEEELRSAESARSAPYDPSPATRQASWEQKFIVRAMSEEMNSLDANKENLARWGRAAKKWARQVAQGAMFAEATKILATTDTVLRGISVELADIFYTPSQGRGNKGDVGFIRASDNMRMVFQGQLNIILGEDWTTPEAVKALASAQSDATTASLEGSAKEVRVFLEKLRDNYVGNSNTTMGKQDNYFVRALDLQAIYERKEDFVQLILSKEPNFNELNQKDRDAAEERVVDAVDKLQNYQQSIIDDDPVEIDSLEPDSGITKALLLTKSLTRDDLVGQNFLLPPEVALIQYVRHVVKRVEYDRRVPPVGKDDKKKGALDRVSQLLADLPAEKRATAKAIIQTHMGYNNKPVAPFWRKLSSYAQFLQFVTILPFATLGSLPDLGGPLINSKEFNAFGTWAKEFKKQFKDPEEGKRFGEMVGVVASEAMANTWMSSADQDFLDPKIRELSQNFFKYTGLEFLTRFSRQFAAGMGAEFLSTHAHNKAGNPRSARYLEQLGVTSADVMAWEKSGATRQDRSFESPEGEKVRLAIVKFVADSVLKPNSAERPLWASDPRFALVWQLKSFMYSFGKVIVGGIAREAKTRMAEGGNTYGSQLGAVALPMALSAIALLPLAMLGLELREYIKVGLSFVVPGVESSDKYLRTNDMEWGEYLAEIVERTGIYGPMSIVAMMSQNAEWGKSPILPLLGPTAETMSEVLAKGWDGNTTLQGNRLLPVFGQF